MKVESKPLFHKSNNILLVVFMSDFPNFQGTDLSFVEKLNVHLARNPHYEKTSRSNSVKFVINHYAGKVGIFCENK